MGSRICLALCFALAVASCGGGSGEGTSTAPAAQTVSGKVLDGYISGATVFWDCNGNSIPDASEISTATGAGGDYTLALAPSSNCRLMAWVGPMATDSDSPFTTVGRPYTMSAAPGVNTIISALTTMVVGKLNSGEASTVAIADSQVSSELGLTGSVLVDYKAQSNDAFKLMAATAKLAVGAFQAADLKLSFSDSIKSAYNAVRAAISTPGVREAQFENATPFVYKDTALAELNMRIQRTPNPNNLVQRAIVDPSPEVNAYLDNIAILLSQQHAADYGSINFQLVDVQTLRGWVARMNVLAVGSADPTRSAAIQALRASRNQLMNTLGAAYQQTVSDETGISTLLTANPKASLDFSLEVMSEFTNLAKDGAIIYVSGISGGAADGARALVQQAGLLDRLTKISEVLSKTSDAGLCYSKLYSALSPSGAATNEALTDAFSACITFANTAAQEAKVLSKYKTLKAAIDGGAHFTTFSTDLLPLLGGADTAESKIQAWKVIADVLGCVSDILFQINLPHSGIIAGLFDGTLQYLNGYITGQELLLASQSVVDANLKKAQAFYDSQIVLIEKSYYVNYLAFYSDYFRVIDSGSVPYVIAVTSTPVVGTLGAGLPIVVTGKNLPLTALLTLVDGTCRSPTAQTALGFTTVCTPSASAGSKLMTILTGNSGAMVNNIHTLEVAALTCSAPSIALNGVCVQVTSVTPTTATAGASTIFTVTGINLPLTSVLNLADGSCAAPTNVSTAGFTVQCTPGSTSGVRTLTVSASAGGTVIDAGRSVTVSSASSGLNFSDSFDGTSLQSAYWTAIGATTVANGTVSMACGGSASTKGKLVLSGDNGIVIESRFVGTGSNRSSAIYLYDVANDTVNSILVGDTNYSAANATPGMVIGGAGAFQTSAQFGTGTSVSTYKEYRLTLVDKTLTVERGDSLASLNERLSVTLPTSVTGKSFYMVLSGGNSPYCPGTSFDWINVKPYAAPQLSTAFSDAFDGTALDATKWTVSALNGAPATYTVSGGYLNVTVPGGSCGSCGVSDGSRFTPKLSALVGDFEVVISAEEVQRLSRDSSKPLSLVFFELKAGTSSFGAYVMGDVLGNSGTPGHKITTFYQTPLAASYPNSKDLTVGQLYAFQFRVRRIGATVYLAFKLATDSAWTEGAVPDAIPATTPVTLSFIIDSGDGRGTAVNSSFNAKVDFFTIAH